MIIHTMQINKGVTLTILLLALTASTYQQNCKVDKCRVCPNATNITCTSCEQGYYLRTFDGGAKTYNACWKTSKMIWGMLGTLLGALLCCYLCKLCFDIGKNEVNQKGKKLKQPEKKKRHQESTLLSTQRNRQPRSTQLIPQQRPIQPLRPIPLPASPRVQYINPTPPRSQQISPQLSPRVQLNGQPYSFSGQTPMQPNRQRVVIPANRSQPIQYSNPQTQQASPRVVPRISTYRPGQGNNLGNIRTSKPTTIRQPTYNPQPSRPISRPNTYDQPERNPRKSRDEEDIGIDLIGDRGGIESQPGRLDQTTRGITPKEYINLKNGKSKFNQRQDPSRTEPLVRYGDVVKGSAQQNPIRQDSITNSRPIRGHSNPYHEPQVAYRQQNSPKDVNPYSRGTFDQQEAPRMSVSPRVSYTLQPQQHQNEAYLDTRLTNHFDQEMIEEPSSPARPFQGGGIASSLGPRRTSEKMPRN